MQSTRLWYLLGRKLAGEATLEEIRELEQLLSESPEIASRVELHSHYFQMRNRNAEPDEEEASAWQRQLERMQEEFSSSATVVPASVILHKPWLRRAAIPAAAAVLLVLLALAGGRLWMGRRIKETAPLAIASETVRQTGSERARDTLPDGTVVWLNNNSRIAYDRNFGRSNREIKLTGEAFFDVVHKAELPMIVHAGPVDIRVKGTAFNVRSWKDDNKVEASLIRGSIELSFVADHQRKVLLKPNEKIVVRLDAEGSAAMASGKNAAEQTIPLHYTIDTLQAESRSGLIPEISWIENKLVFNSEPLIALKEKMERWYHVRISIRDSSLSAERFTGELEHETLTEALTALQLTYPFHFRIEKDEVTITK